MPVYLNGMQIKDINIDVQAGSVAPALQSKTATPSTSEQTVTPDSGYDGLSSVTVEAVKLQSKTADPATTSQTITPDNGYDGLSSVAVEAMKLQNKSATPTANSQTVNPDNGYDGLSSVSVDAVPTESKSITTNGTYSPSSGKWFSSVSVDVNPTLQSKSVTPSESAQTVNPDTGYDALSSVSVGAVSSTYVGSGVTKKSAATYTPTTSNQTIAANQYLSGAQTIAGDSDLVASNIKSGVNIFNVSGTFTSDATASASDILSAKTAYVNGVKITGTVAYQDYYTGSSVPSSSVGNDGDLYFQTA